MCGGLVRERGVSLKAEDDTGCFRLLALLLLRELGDVVDFELFPTNREVFGREKYV